MTSKTIDLYEFEKLNHKELKKRIKNCVKKEVDDNYIVRIKDELQRVNNKLKVKVIKLFFDSIQATQYVGFIRLKDFSIQIIPKIYKEDESLPNLKYLLFILKYIEFTGISLKKLDLGFMGEQKGDIFKFLIEMFIYKLYELMKTGIFHTYINLTNSTEYIKGKLLISQQLKYNTVKPWLFYCNYEEFRENNLINQIFKNVLILLKNSYGFLKIGKKIDNILGILQNVNLVNISPYHFEKLTFTRLNIKFKPLIEFSRLIITNSNINFQNRTIENFYFLFDMNRLFEKFIGVFIKKNIEEIKVNYTYNILEVEEQARIGSLFDIKLTPDLLIEYEFEGSVKKLLIDFKYKMLSSKKYRHGISTADLYQMFAYSQSQKTKFNDVILLYPRMFQDEIKVYIHEIPPDNLIKIFIKFIDIEKIYDPSKDDVSHTILIQEINNILTI